MVSSPSPGPSPSQAPLLERMLKPTGDGFEFCLMLSLIGGISSTAYTLVDFFLGLKFGALTNFVAGIWYWTIFYLEYRGLFSLTRHVLIWTIIFHIGILTAAVIGSDPGAHYFLLGVAVTGAIFFTNKEWMWKVFYFTFSCALFLLLHYNVFNFVPRETISPELALAFEISCITLTALFIFMILVAYQHTVFSFSHELELQRDRVESRSDALAQEMYQHKKAREVLEKTQSRLVQAEKMSSLGELVAGVAHEINNPVNFVKNNFSLVEKSVGQIETQLKAILPDNDDGARAMALFKNHFEVIEQSSTNHAIGTKRIATIVQSLLAFSRHDEADFKETNINELLDETLVILNNRVKKVSLVRDYGELPPAHCHASQIAQVFLNIIGNALYAALKTQDSAKPEVIISTLTTANNIDVVVQDNGAGISSKVKDSLFDPFVTTKPVGEGTGMGLAICYNIITDHKGEIMVENTNPGAKFTISLPQANTDVPSQGV